MGVEGARRMDDRLPDRFLTTSQAERLRNEIEALRRRQAQLGAQIAETSDMFSGETEGNVLRDDLRWLMREEDRLRALLAYPVLEDSHVAELSGHADAIRIGSVVAVEIDGEPDTLTIVNALEAHPAEGRISSESPVGRALLGARAGSEVWADTPRGRTCVRVVSIEG